jgi:transcriptional regulator with XRE-family HTH domain
MDDTAPNLWPYRDVLVRIRAGRSLERVAREVDVNRVTWHKWETGVQWPSNDSLRAIVEKFGVPPDLVGYAAPEGWELVPVEWIREQFDAQSTKLDAILSVLRKDSA